jgi:hypothetical protein
MTKPLRRATTGGALTGEAGAPPAPFRRWFCEHVSRRDQFAVGHQAVWEVGQFGNNAGHGRLATVAGRGPSSRSSLPPRTLVEIPQGGEAYTAIRASRSGRTLVAWRCCKPLHQASAVAGSRSPRPAGVVPNITEAKLSAAQPAVAPDASSATHRLRRLVQRFQRPRTRQVARPTGEQTWGSQDRGLPRLHGGNEKGTRTPDS